MTFRNLLMGTLLVTPLAVTLPACDDDTPGEMPDDIALRSFSSCTDLRDYTEEVILEQLVMSRYGYWGWFGIEDDAMGDGPSQDSGTSGPSDYTTTNVQEQGVDEVDIVKTDGTHLYVVDEGELFVVSSWPVEETEVIGRVEIGDYAHGLFLYGDQALVFSYFYDDGTGWNRSYSGTRLSFVDVSDRTTPTVTRTLDYEGWFADGRLIGDDAYVVLNTWLPLPDDAWQLVWDDNLGLPDMDWEADEDAQEDLRDEARRLLRPHIHSLVRSIDLDEILPMYRDQVIGRPDATPTLLHECSDVYRPAEVSQYSMMSVIHVDLESGDHDATGVMSDGWEVYASQDNLYVAQTSWWWWWGAGDLELDTHIHKFALNGEAPEYVAAGSVDGWLLNQFSMSEHDGYLRVASTERDWWWGTGQDEGGNHVTVLADLDGHLTEVGSVRDIAPGEQITAVRMMGDTGYVVTFEQIDPLFTIDLSDPTHPTLEGELELPGFSSYLHPIGDDFLLAVGQAGDMDGNITGLAVSIFDVSDFQNPTLAHQFTLEDEDWAWSEALWDHHAFTFHRGILSIPIYTYDYDDITGNYEGFSGMLVMSAHPYAGITEIGRVDHGDLITASDCPYEWECDSIWYASMRRSVYIEDNLFSISNYGVKVSDLYEPSTQIATAVFRPSTP